MIRLDYWLFGYMKIQISEEDIPKALTALLTANLTASLTDGEILVFAPSVKKYKRALTGVRYTVTEIQGLPGEFYRRRKRFGAFFALLMLGLFFAFSSMFVWDVRIIGNENISTSAVEDELDKVGIRPGALWKSLLLNKAERQLLEESETIGWLNINRQGSVAYVTVKEKEIKAPQSSEKYYSNIVAVTDCVIEEITVKSGFPMVKAGDTVKAGQLLISGVIPNELGGGFVRAEGEVKGRVFEKISVEVPRRETVTVYEDEVLSECHINIFDFSLNIFKNYGNLPESYVIINDIEEVMLLGRWRLPMEIKRIYFKTTKKQSVERSDADLISIASSRLSALRAMRLSEAELLKIKTEGEFTDNGYRMTSSVTLLCGIGEEKVFAP